MFGGLHLQQEDLFSELGSSQTLLIPSLKQPASHSTLPYSPLAILYPPVVQTGLQMAFTPQQSVHKLVFGVSVRCGADPHETHTLFTLTGVITHTISLTCKGIVTRCTSGTLHVQYKQNTVQMMNNKYRIRQPLHT